MSKIIKDSEEPKSDSSTQASLSSATVVEHLKSCQKLAEAAAGTFFQEFVKDYDQALCQEMDNAKSNQESQDVGAALSVFRQELDQLERYYLGYICEGFIKFRKRQLNTTIGSSDTSATDGLSLIGNDDLDETIALTSLTHRVDQFFAEPLWALNQRFAVLNGGEPISEANNPSAPIQLCESLRKALKCLPISGYLKNIAYKTYDVRLVSLAKEVIGATNDYLKQNGILPNLKYTLPSGDAPAPYLSKEAPSQLEHGDEQFDQNIDLDDDLPPEEYQAQLVGAIRALQQEIIVSQRNSAAANSQAVIDQSQLLSALGQMQLTNTASGNAGNGNLRISVTDDAEAYQIDQVVERLQALLGADEDVQLQQNDMHTIDLVGMVFEYMLNDENIPDKVKALLSHLHTPFLKIAFIDPGFIEQNDHHARLLLNSLAEAGSRWVGNDGTEQHGVFEKTKEIVERILKDFDKDIEFISRLLLEFNAFIKNIVRRQELVERRATERAEGEEKLREVKVQVNKEIRQRTKDRELPSALLLFLLQPWSDYLSFSLLRYGVKSEKWHGALSLIDDLIWAVQPKIENEDKATQIELQEKIIERITIGLDTIGFDQNKGQKLIHAISSLMKHALQSKKVQAAPAPMREKLEKIAAEKAGSDADVEEAATAEESDMVEKLKLLEFGSWFEFEGGKRVKLAWYNKRTSHYMLVDQLGKRVAMMSGLDMARQMIEGKAKIISSSAKPFFERALENIFRRLSEKASVKNPPAGV